MTNLDLGRSSRVVFSLWNEISMICFHKVNSLEISMLMALIITLDWSLICQWSSCFRLDSVTSFNQVKKQFIFWKLHIKLCFIFIVVMFCCQSYPRKQAWMPWQIQSRWKTVADHGHNISSWCIILSSVLCICCHMWYLLLHLIVAITVLQN